MDKLALTVLALGLWATCIACELLKLEGMSLLIGILALVATLRAMAQP